MPLASLAAPGMMRVLHFSNTVYIYIYIFWGKTQQAFFELTVMTWPRPRVLYLPDAKSQLTFTVSQERNLSAKSTLFQLILFEVPRRSLHDLWQGVKRSNDPLSCCFVKTNRVVKVERFFLLLLAAYKVRPYYGIECAWRTSKIMKQNRHIYCK